MTGLVMDGAGFELLAGQDRIGERRLLLAADVALLTDVAARYARAVRTRSHQQALLGLGWEFYAWLDGEQGQLGVLLERTPRPAVFEVEGSPTPTDVAWAVLRAPWELLARTDGGFLAEDGLLQFCVVRRLGKAKQSKAADDCLLGLAFMASAARGGDNLLLGDGAVCPPDLSALNTVT